VTATSARSAAVQEYYRHLDAGSCARDLEAHALRLEGKRVLDVGCGPGHYLVELARHGAAAVVGADVDAARLAFARAELRRRGVGGVTLVCADGTRLPFASGSFDVVLCLLTLPYVEDDARAIQEIARLLKPGGILVLSGHDLGFPLGYLAKRRLKPLLLYPLTLAYRLTGRKLARNTLQTRARTFRELERAGISVESVQLKRGPLHLVEVFTVKGIRSSGP
jgi:SAM-dependent methyltransferase